MSRETFVCRNGKIVSKQSAAPLETGKRVHVISDVMEPVRHMGTGRMHDSKSQFRSDTRAIGAEEVGTDPAIARARPRNEPGGIEIDVKRAMQEVASR